MSRKARRLAQKRLKAAGKTPHRRSLGRGNHAGMHIK